MRCRSFRSWNRNGVFQSRRVVGSTQQPVFASGPPAWPILKGVLRFVAEISVAGRCIRGVGSCIGVLVVARHAYRILGRMQTWPTHIQGRLWPLVLASELGRSGASCIGASSPAMALKLPFIRTVLNVLVTTPHGSLPVGQNSCARHELTRQVPPGKIFHFTEILISRTSETPWPSTRGGSRSSRTAGQAAMDATASGASGIAGRPWP